MTPAPMPLTPVDCDLKDFKFMPLEVARLRDSDLVSEQTPEENWAAVLLWAACWHQVPAASMPNSDNWIAKAAGYMMRGSVDERWHEIKAGAMRGFILCSDGRWYHPVVAEKANESWVGKLKQRLRTECGRIKKHNDRHGMKIPFPEFEAWFAAGCPQGQPLPVPDDVGPGPLWSDDYAVAGSMDASPSAAINVPRDSPPMSLGTNSVVPRDTPPLSLGTNSNVPRDTPHLSQGTTPIVPWDMPPLSLENTPLVPRETASKGERQGQGEGELTSKAKGSGSSTVYDHNATQVAPLPLSEVMSINNPAATLAATLRKWGVDAVFTHPAVREWADAGVPLEILAAAVATARERKGPTAKIAPNYLRGRVNDLLNPSAPAVSGNTCASRPAEPPRKPQGMDPKGLDESYDDYEARVSKAEADRRQAQTRASAMPREQGGAL